ncbi:Hydrogenase maturation protein HypC [Desulfotomaculum arcticum]|uniref:Hydrogenase maturation protein HypC n=1 Tax=Desulfotruncus arcticus DSM 17038 TaxID=1121424 RepID=A0A1I2YR87_9FIRM|nr:HypC/HybG/HupF family hydrogenase formation chaperone [Desulfotruncus arcticus]SFH28068.1 Hydrogenase maturation protein HypC [Desulfotomaculum arcticum] [Desulfotruncus arcticus DSM 17038]
MCLGVPGKVVEVNPAAQMAVIETMGVKRQVGIQLVADVRPGDYVMVHAGYAIEKINTGLALETIGLWEDIVNNENP